MGKFTRHDSMAMFDRPFSAMGVLNITPDSFSDGGKFMDTGAALEHAAEMVEQGAGIIDVGGESTRPGAAPVGAEEELRRVLPVVKALGSRNVPVSIDTTKASVAAAALDAGAVWINDVSAGRFDARMAPLAARRGCPVVLMHSRKTPADMQDAPYYANVAEEVQQELAECAAMFISRGVSRENIILDPGIGFAKRLEDNLALVKNINALAANGFNLLAGLSRKSFVGAITGRSVHERLAGTLAATGEAFAGGVKMFRVHDVKETVDYLNVLCAIKNAR